MLTESKGTALSIIATGDVIEECVGGQHSIKATKILITATDQLEIDAQNISVMAPNIKLSQPAVSEK